MKWEPSITVPLSGGRDYPIFLDGSLHDVGTKIASVVRSRRTIILSQPKIAERYAGPVGQSLERAGFAPVPVLTFPAGERYKNLATVTRLCDGLYNLSPAIDRKTAIVALGGGVVGDVVGFVASIYLRGLDYIQIPTTLLAMVDSSVGGKTGVDFREGKNLVGAFHQPKAVIVDTATLKSLSRREIRSGMAEVIKYGVIRDPSLLESVAECVHGRAYGRGFIEPEIFTHLVRRSCEIKAEVVAADEFETTGLRAHLNFGHTVGHALESVTAYKRFKHGEAVGIGMMAAAFIGEEAGVTPPHVAEAIRNALVAQGLPTVIPADIAPEAILPLLARDKKAVGGKARFVLARELGDVALYNDVNESAVLAGVQRAYAR